MGDADELQVSDALPVKRGCLLNEYTGAKEYLVLRNGVLRILQPPRGPENAAIFFQHGSSVTLLANHVIEVSSKSPFAQEYILQAATDVEAEGWHDAIKASIKSEQEKMAKLRELMEDGCVMHKYNYSNSKRSRRYFWVADDGRQLCWGRSRGVDTQSVNLRECIGIIYGPMTTTFQRCPSLDDCTWTCFSLLFMGRTLDLAVGSDLQVRAWFLGLQHLIAVHGIGSMPMMSDAQFIAKKVQFKLMAVAHRKGLVLSRHLINRVRMIAAGKLEADEPVAPMSKSSSSRVNGAANGAGRSGVHATFLPMAAVKDAKQPKSTGGGEAGEAMASPVEDSKTAALRTLVLQLQTTLRDRQVRAELAEALVARGSAGSALQDDLRAAAIESLKRRADSVAVEVGRLTESQEKLAPQVQNADKIDKTLKKLQQRFDEVDAKRAALEREIGGERASAEASSGAKQGSSQAEAEVIRKNGALERRVKELEAKLLQAQGAAHAEAEAARNRQQNEAIAAAESESLALKQKLDELRRHAARAQEADRLVTERLTKLKAMNGRLGPQLGELARTAQRLREDQRKAKAETQSAKQVFSTDFAKALKAMERMGEENALFETKYKAAIEDRKKLHNLILDLKGNIRVFVRVRPINAKEIPTENVTEPTVQFKDDTNIGIYDAGYNRRKWFEFDQVFDPNTAQAQVFEEAKPLATSVLDGYNVCVFAYGQTGSGKTHTMTGNAKDPGLNTNVLAELFRIRKERQGEYEINMSIAVTEIYNETVRDLLGPSKQKLDVKINQDGTSSVPGLTEKQVTSVEEVMKCIDEASKNRATSTTDMNEQSSRSHSIVTVRTQCTLRGSDTYFGKIHLIDLAGSENTNKSGVTGQGMKEAQNINKSLSALGDVIQSLVAKNPHTPYRNSKLTMMLKDSLGGDSKTLMIVCASPAQTNATETLSSLNFASRARNVELGKAKRNSQAAN